MLTAATIESAIATSIETIRHRLQRVPISAEAIQRVYGVDRSTAAELARGINIFDALVSHRDIETAQLTCSYSLVTLDQAEYRVADLLSGLPGMHRLKFYSSIGVITYRSVVAFPDHIGLINSVSHVGGYIFRLPAPDQEHAFSLGEPVTTELWRCNAEDAGKVDDYRDRGGFEAWKRTHATRIHPPVTIPQNMQRVLHVEFAVRCTGERLHALATQPEVTSIVSLDGQDAFK